MSQLPPPPAALKPIKKYLLQAKRLDKVDPVIAYYCRQYAVENAMTMPERKLPEVKQFLGALLGKLEADRGQVAHLTKEESCVHLRDFALRVFKGADETYRAGKATNSTKMQFHTAYIILDVCQQFGDLEDEVANVCKYAIWKVAEIQKALREGRQPGPSPEELAAGGPGGPGGPGDAAQQPASEPGAAPSDEPGGAPPQYEPAPAPEPSPSSAPELDSSAFAQPAAQAMPPIRQKPERPVSQPVHRPKPSGSAARDKMVLQKAIKEAEAALRKVTAALRFKDCDAAVAELEVALATLRPHTSNS